MKCQRNQQTIVNSINQIMMVWLIYYDSFDDVIIIYSGSEIEWDKGTDWDSYYKLALTSFIVGE